MPAAPVATGISPIEILGTPRLNESLPLTNVIGTGGLAFVEGVAVVQALCDAITAEDPRNASMPILSGAFLDYSGNVLINGPASGDPAPRELARLLHEIVSADSMPPAARLFIGRWTSNDSTDLAAFAAELAYFARPNGRELTAAIYSRSSSSPAPAPFNSVQPRRQIQSDPTPAAEVKKPKPPEQHSVRDWLRAHRTELMAVTGVLAIVLVVGLGAWMWPTSISATANKLFGPSVGTSAESTVEPGGNAPASSAAGKGNRNGRAAGRRAAASNGGALVTRESPINEASAGAPVSPQAADTSASLPEPPSVSARGVPDIRIYSEADAGVEPPRLRSTEILQMVIAGFERRTNSVELLIDDRGRVQTTQMINGPQRMTDIMLLSRMKELQFDPASRNGIPVRYRMILTWSVTP